MWWVVQLLAIPGETVTVPVADNMSKSSELPGPLVRYLPALVLTTLVRRYPTLVSRLLRGRSISWPYYQGDLVVRIDPTNTIEREMMNGYDPGVCQVVNRFVMAGSHCIDVGANVGPVTLLMAKQVGPTGRVLAIEPGPPYVERLKWNLAANRSLTGRVAVLTVGLSDAEGTLVWRPDPDHPFNAGLSAIHTQSVVNEVTVPVSTLDVAVSDQGWDRVDFVKIDVEGMELEVLRGAQRTLQKYRPVVLFETIEHFRKLRRERSGISDVFAEIGRLFAGLGYRLCDLAPDSSVHSVDIGAWPANTLALPIERNGSLRIAGRNFDFGFRG